MGLLSKLFGNVDDVSTDDLEAVENLVDDMIWHERTLINGNVRDEIWD